MRFICINFRQSIFKRPLLDIAKYGCINLHSIITKISGFNAYFLGFKNNEKYTGVSFFFDEGIDSGEILVQEKIEILDRSQASLIGLTKKSEWKQLLNQLT